MALYRGVSVVEATSQLLVAAHRVHVKSSLRRAQDELKNRR